jgi:hypothetical protein
MHDLLQSPQALQSPTQSVRGVVGMGIDCNTGRIGAFTLVVGTGLSPTGMTALLMSILTSLRSLREGQSSAKVNTILSVSPGMMAVAMSLVAS